MAITPTPKAAKITIETTDGNVAVHAHYVSFNRNEWGNLTSIEINQPFGFTTTAKKEATVSPEAPATESGLNNEQRQALELVLTRAKAIERQQFHNARAIASAAREAGKLMADSEHKFSMGILDALHAGLTQEAVEEHLEDHGFNQLTEKVDAVHMLDTELLYPSEA